MSINSIDLFKNFVKAISKDGYLHNTFILYGVEVWLKEIFVTNFEQESKLENEFEIFIKNLDLIDSYARLNNQEIHLSNFFGILFQVILDKIIYTKNISKKSKSVSKLTELSKNQLYNLRNYKFIIGIILHIAGAINSYSIIKSILSDFIIDKWDSYSSLNKANNLLLENIYASRIYSVPNIFLNKSLINNFTLPNILTNKVICYSDEVKNLKKRFNCYTDSNILKNELLCGIFIYKEIPKEFILKANGNTFIANKDTNLWFFIDKNGDLASFNSYYKLSVLSERFEPKKGPIAYEILRSLVLTEIANLIVPNYALPNLGNSKSRNKSKSRNNNIRFIENKLLLPTIKHLQSCKEQDKDYKIEQSRDCEYEEEGRLVKVRAHLRRLREGQHAGEQAIAFGKKLNWNFDPTQFTLVRSHERELHSMNIPINDTKLGIYRNKLD